jgi:hypothetical protein
MTDKIPLPREHGAWGMLLQPFVAGAIVGRSWDPHLFPALLAVLIVFAARQPLLILARQRFLWRDEHPETALAKRALVYEATLLAACGALLLDSVPVAVLAILGSLAAGLTALAVYMTLKNRQRSVLLQSMSAFGLGSSALLGGYFGTRNFWDQRTWAVWILLSLHFLTGIFLVHARLDRRGKKPDSAATLQRAVALIGLSVLLAVIVLLLDRAEWVLPLLISAGICALEVYLVTRPDAGIEPLKQVGLRALFGSIMHTLVTVASLW